MYPVQFRMATDIQFEKILLLIVTCWFGLTKIKQNQKLGNYIFVLIARYIGKLKECKY